MRSIYWQELWCHIPSSRKGDAGERRDREKRLNSLLNAAPSIHHIAPQTELIALGRDQDINTRVWMDGRRHQPASNPSRQSGNIEDNQEPEQRDPWILPMLVGIHSVNANRLPPMPISIDNKLPCVDFKLGYGSRSCRFGCSDE